MKKLQLDWGSRMEFKNKGISPRRPQIEPVILPLRSTTWMMKEWRRYSRGTMSESVEVQATFN